MSQKNQPALQCRMRKDLCRFLALCWILGVLYGITVYCSAAEMFASLMRSCIYDAVSIVDLFWVNVLPFLLSAFAVFLSAPVMLFFVSFGKAFLTGLISLGILDVFGYAGWLCRGLFPFSSWAAVPVLYLYWIRSVQEWTLVGRILCTAVAGAAVLGICIFDFCVISPYWASLIDL